MLKSLGAVTLRRGHGPGEAPSSSRLDCVRAGCSSADRVAVRGRARDLDSLLAIPAKFAFVGEDLNCTPRPNAVVLWSTYTVSLLPTCRGNPREPHTLNRENPAGSGTKFMLSFPGVGLVLSCLVPASPDVGLGNGGHGLVQNQILRAAKKKQ